MILGWFVPENQLNQGYQQVYHIIASSFQHCLRGKMQQLEHPVSQSSMALVYTIHRGIKSFQRSCFGQGNARLERSCLQVYHIIATSFQHCLRGKMQLDVDMSPPANGITFRLTALPFCRHVVTGDDRQAFLTTIMIFLTTGSSSWACQFLNCQNRTRDKGDMTKNANFLKMDLRRFLTPWVLSWHTAGH